jgi:hypothetical protein
MIRFSEDHLEFFHFNIFSLLRQKSHPHRFSVNKGLRKGQALLFDESFSLGLQSAFSLKADVSHYLQGCYLSIFR